MSEMHGTCEACKKHEGRYSESFQGVICDECYTDWCDAKLDDLEDEQ